MKPDVIVMGAGGHAKVCIELLRASGSNVAFAIGGDDSPETCVGVKVLKGDHHLAQLAAEGYSKAFIAIGSNALRSKLADFAIQQGFSLVNAISPMANISPSVTLGVGIAVMAGATINADSRIDDLAIINTGATVDHDCRVGRAAHVAPQCGVAGSVHIGERSFLGIGTKVIPNIEIGAEAIVGAGSVVIRPVQAGSKVLGTPARLVSPRKV